MTANGFDATHGVRPRTAGPRRASTALLFALTVLLATASVARPDAAPTAQALLDAFKDGVPEEVRVDAVAAAKGVAEPRVVQLLADALRDPSVSVRRAAIDALGAIDHPDALSQLHALYRHDEKLRKDEETFVRLLRAIGRKGEPASVEILADDYFDHATLRTAAARIQGLGRIRTDASLAALFELTTRAGGVSRRPTPSAGRGGTPVDQDFRLSIAVLTSADLAADRAAWQRWWRDNKRTFHVAIERPNLSRPLVIQWEQYWGERYYADRAPPPAPRIGPPVAIVENPSREDVDEAVTVLHEAFSSSGDAETRIMAIGTFGGVLHEDVVAAVAKGLSDADDGVRLAAIDTLGWTPRIDALKQLHRLYRRDANLREDEVLFSRLLQAIGRHGDRSSLDVLEDHPFDHLTLASGRARILGVARVRDKRSVEILIKGMRLAGADPRGTRSGSPRFMDDFQLALSVLTGEDLASSREAWESWWREHRDFVPAPVRPPLRATLRAAWEEYWNESY